jgi:hypothetical protein
MKRLIRILILPAIFFAFSALCFAQDKLLPEKCDVLGTVADTRGYLVPGMQIIFSRGENTGTADSDITGKYKIHVAAGIYDIRLKRGVSFARYRRARYEVSCEGDQTLNLTYLPECSSWGCTDLGYSFATLPADWTRRKRLNAVISYDTKKNTKSGINYQDTMLTFNRFTVAGARIIQNSTRRTLLVKGPGWIDDGKNRREFESLKIKFTKSGIDIIG